MKIQIRNKLNTLPATINIIWSVILIFLFIFRVPEFETQKPDGAGILIFGIIIISLFLFISSLLFISLVNLYFKSKIYLDIYFAFIPVILLVIIISLRL